MIVSMIRKESDIKHELPRTVNSNIHVFILFSNAQQNLFPSYYMAINVHFQKKVCDLTTYMQL